MMRGSNGPGACRRAPLLTLVGAAMLLGGCNGAHLYNASEHELAKSAQSAFAEAKLTESVAQERELMGKFLERELEVVRRHVLARRDLNLVVLLQKDTVDEFRGRVNWRINELVGNAMGADTLDPAVERTANDLVTAIDSLDEKETSLRAAEARYRVTVRGTAGAGEPDLFRRPTAGTMPGVETNDRKGLEAVYDRLEQARGEYKAARDTVLGVSTGKIAELTKQIHDVEEADAAIDKEVAGFSEELRKAKGRHDEEVARAGRNEAKELAEKVRQKLSALENAEEHAAASQQTLAKHGLTGLGLDGLIEALKERQKAVAELLDAVISEKGNADPDTPESKQRLLRVAAVLPSAYRSLTAGQHYPRVSALVIESNRLRLEIEAAEKRRAAAGHVLEILRLKRDHMYRELVLLVRCRKDLGVVAANKKVSAVLTDKDPNNREQLLRGNSAFLDYASAWSVHRLAEEQATYMLLAARHDASLDASEAALAQWQNLIAEPIAQLVALHGAGLKSQDLANLIQAGGLGAIAYGVNK